MRLRTLAALLIAATALTASLPAAAQAGTAPSRSSGAAPKSADVVVDVNKASAAELTQVPGIGNALAKRIVEFREKNGPFSKVEDLVKVQGIGEKSILRLAPHLTVSKGK